MWYLWLIFGICAVWIPVGSFLVAVKVAKPYLHDKQKMKIIAENIIKYCLFYWLCDLFFMSFIIDNIVCKYIFGGLIMLIIFYNLSNVFVNQHNRKKNFLVRWGLLQDFIVGIALSIYLIFIIPDDNLREIVSVIVAAIYGGLLTLVSVAWTIQFTKNERMEQDKKRDEERREEERKKYRPIFNVYHGEIPSNFLDAHFEDFNGIYEIGYGYQGTMNQEHQVVIENFILENSCFTEFYIRGVKINNKQYDRNRNLFVKKGSYVQFDLDHMPLYLPEIFQTISLIVEDLLGNVYEVPFGTEIDLKDGIRHIEIKGNRRIKIGELINE